MIGVTAIQRLAQNVNDNSYRPSDSDSYTITITINLASDKPDAFQWPSVPTVFQKLAQTTRRNAETILNL